jgi:hypothetical protein
MNEMWNFWNSPEFYENIIEPLIKEVEELNKIEPIIPADPELIRISHKAEKVGKDQYNEGV